MMGIEILHNDDWEIGSEVDSSGPWVIFVQNEPKDDGVLDSERISEMTLSPEEAEALAGELLSVAKNARREYRRKFEPFPTFTSRGNPILKDFRRVMRSSMWKSGTQHSPGHAAWWLRLIEDDPKMENPMSWGSLTDKITPENIEHAKAVLTRITALEKK